MLVEVAHTGREEFDGAGEVLFVAHLDDLVDVAGGNGDGAGDGAAGCEALQAGGIGSATCQDFRLPADLPRGRAALDATPPLDD